MIGRIGRGCARPVTGQDRATRTTLSLLQNGGSSTRLFLFGSSGLVARSAPPADFQYQPPDGKICTLGPSNEPVHHVLFAEFSDASAHIADCEYCESVMMLMPASDECVEGLEAMHTTIGNQMIESSINRSRRPVAVTTQVIDQLIGAERARDIAQSLDDRFFSCGRRTAL
jgi:hypothetical protein